MHNTKKITMYVTSNFYGTLPLISNSCPLLKLLIPMPANPEIFKNFANYSSCSSHEGGHLDFDTKDDVEKPSTDF